jgi:nitroreductase
LSKLDEIIQGRRSIRKYTEGKVDVSNIEEIIKAGTWAPTACNIQGFRFIYIDDNQKLVEVSKMGSAHFLVNCKQAILVLYDNRTDNIEYHDDILSAGAVIQNMLLKAHELGIGTCWVCNLPLKSKLRTLFSIPKYYNPIALITLGHVETMPRTVPRMHTVGEVMFCNAFSVARDPQKKKSSLHLALRKYLRMIYIRLPKNAFIKRVAGRFEKKFDN